MRLTTSLVIAFAAVALRATPAAGQEPPPPPPPPPACTLPGVDRASAPQGECLACHDGSSASDARAGHKFGFDYTAARSRPGADLRLDPQGKNGVILQDGQVTCLTCHAPTSTLVNHLAAPTGGPVADRLCVACHVY